MFGANVLRAGPLVGEGIGKLLFDESNRSIATRGSDPSHPHSMFEPNTRMPKYTVALAGEPESV
jgi:hypothetical protein